MEKETDKKFGIKDDLTDFMRPAASIEVTDKYLLYKGLEYHGGIPFECPNCGAYVLLHKYTYCPECAGVEKGTNIARPLNFNSDFIKKVQSDKNEQDRSQPQPRPRQ